MINKFDAMRMLIFTLIAIKGLLHPILASLLLAVEDGFVLSAAAVWKNLQNSKIIVSRHLRILYYKRIKSYSLSNFKNNSNVNVNENLKCK